MTSTAAEEPSGRHEFAHAPARLGLIPRVGRRMPGRAGAEPDKSSAGGASDAFGQPSGRSSVQDQAVERVALARPAGLGVTADYKTSLVGTQWCVQYWIDGGATDLAGLALVCRRHHRLVHGGWELAHRPDGIWSATLGWAVPASRTDRDAALSCGP